MKISLIMSFKALIYKVLEILISFHLASILISPYSGKSKFIR